MNLPSSKIEEMKQTDLDALVDAYNRLNDMMSKAMRVAENIFLAGMGVEMSDPRFYERMAAHKILSAMKIKEDK